MGCGSCIEDEREEKSARRDDATIHVEEEAVTRDITKVPLLLLRLRKRVSGSVDQRTNSKGSSYAAPMEEDLYICYIGYKAAAMQSPNRGILP